MAWATFATGTPPGEHGIFDFVQRDAATYLPRVATTRVHHAVLEQNQLTAPWVDNLRQGEAFWDVIARAKVAVRTLSVPYAYPPRLDGARALAASVPPIYGEQTRRLLGLPPIRSGYARMPRLVGR